MDLAHLYRMYSHCAVGLVTRNTSGDESIATGFHIGDGFLLTARHVVENRPIVNVLHHVYASITRIHTIRYPPDDAVDLALLSSDFNLDHYMSDAVTIVGFNDKRDAIVIGDHLDDWIGYELMLAPVLTMGFPPVPTSLRPALVATAGQVNAILDRYTSPHVHFVISPAPRGGFSGGPVLLENGLLLGIVTEALERDSSSREVGFTVTLSVEPIHVLLAEQRIAPRANRLTYYLLAVPGDDEQTVTDHLDQSELVAFKAYRDNPSTENPPTSLGTPTPPIIDGPAMWEAPSQDERPDLSNIF